MAAFFNSKELYRVAMEMERNGLAYYTGIAKNADDEQAGAIFDYLASSEKRHLKTFRKLWGNASKKKPPESYKGEYRQYVRALIKDSVFPSPASAKSRAARSGPGTALRTGIKAEKDSILFYAEMLDLVEPPDKKAVNRILAEEKRHLRRLMEYKQSGCI